MPKVRDNANQPSDVSNTSTVAHLENEGRFDELLALLRSVPLTELDARSLAALARAAALRGEPELARVALGFVLKREGIDGSEAWIVARLAEAALERIELRWAPALALAEEARDLAKRLEARVLEADATFAVAFAQAELGRLFLALDLYESLYLDESLPKFRQGLAAANAAWLLWDLGRLDSLRSVLPKIPVETRPRHELSLELVEGRVEIALLLLAKPPQGLYPKDRRLLAFELAEAVFVFELREAGADSWILDEMRACLELDAETAALAARALSLVQGTRDDAWPEIPEGATWRTRLHCHFYEALLSEPNEARKIWLERINPLLDRHRLLSPLLPRLGAETLEPATGWSAAILSRSLGVSSEPQPLEVQDRGVRLGGREVDLSKSPASLTLLRALAGPKGHVVAKREIHMRLTKSSYNPRLHDPRILKLLYRLEKRLEASGIPPAWSLPRDNSVVLRTGIVDAGVASMKGKKELS